MHHAASNTPHTHPRGSEISTVISGSMTFGMVEENALHNVPIIRSRLSIGQTIHIPQGTLLPQDGSGMEAAIDIMIGSPGHHCQRASLSL